MKKFTTVIISVMLAAIMMILPSAQVSASAESGGQYISEMKIGVGKKAADAEKSLEGYEMLKDDSGNYVDLNQKAGGGTLSKGERVVYLGYKRTSSRANAITDLAVMSMKGGYSTEDYDALMENTYMKEQIIPFVDSFISTIMEYRENYNSKNSSNKQRAQYLHDALNKLTDDDCDGAGLGDLLLNETKYEMGDDAYNKLSDEEKKKHADILTIVAQSNGQATLMLEKLLTCAADSNENTWLDRMKETTYDDLVDETNLSPSKAKKQLDKLYYDDAEKILDMWDPFKEELEGYDTAIEEFEKEKDKDYSEQEKIIENYDINTATDEQSEEYGKAVAEVEFHLETTANLYADVMCKEYLETIKYNDGTLLDFFKKSKKTVEKDISVLYPLVAALSDGQRAGIDLVTLEDLVMLGVTDENGYKDSGLDEIETVSIYDGVDRGIYAKGGVGLTSDAQRADALAKASEKSSSNKLSILTFASYALTGAAVFAFAATATVKLATKKSISSLIADNSAKILTLQTSLKKATQKAAEFKSGVDIYYDGDLSTNLNIAQLEEYTPTLNKLNTVEESITKMEQELESLTKGDSAKDFAADVNRLSAKSTTCSKLMVGITVVMIILTAISVYLTYNDLVNYYKVDFTPIPRYMIDEKDLIYNNEKNEKIVRKNQLAYYKAILCNRTEKDEMYKTVGDVGDLNGDVGQQWLALYAERNNLNQPILADSFKVVLKDEQVPAGYSTGIHFFGTEAAENLNNTLYVWNSSAPKVYVYYKTEEGSGAEGSSFIIGYIAIAAGAGLLIGAVVTAICMNAAWKRKKKKTV